MAQDDSIEEITVTGSHIRRTEYDGRAPIQIVDQEKFELIGAVQPIEMVKELTVNSGSAYYNETNNGQGISQFNIRNLGLGSTLTLINGKRGGIAAVGDATGTDFVDINQFPLAMISRIEVLTNGASATYGSQAVAGVANIITRKGYGGSRDLRWLLDVGDRCLAHEPGSRRQSRPRRLQYLRDLLRAGSQRSYGIRLAG